MEMEINKKSGGETPKPKEGWLKRGTPPGGAEAKMGDDLLQRAKKDLAVEARQKMDREDEEREKAAADEELKAAKETRQAMDRESLAEEAEKFFKNQSRVRLMRTDGEVASALVTGFSKEQGTVDVLYRENGVVKPITMTLEQFGQEQEKVGLAREIQGESLTEKGEAALELLENTAPGIFDKVTKSKWLLAGRAGGYFTKGLGLVMAAGETPAGAFVGDLFHPAAQDAVSVGRLTGILSPEKTIEIDDKQEKVADQRGYVGTTLTALWGAPDSVLKAFKASEEYQSTVASTQFELGALDYQGVTGRVKSTWEKMADKAKDAARYFFSPVELAGTEVILPLVKDSAEAIRTIQQRIEKAAGTSPTAAAEQAVAELDKDFDDMDAQSERIATAHAEYDRVTTQAADRLRMAALHDKTWVKKQREKNSEAGKAVETLQGVNDSLESLNAINPSMEAEEKAQAEAQAAKVALAKKTGAEAKARVENFNRVVNQGEANLKLQEDIKARAEKKREQTDIANQQLKVDLAKQVGAEAKARAEADRARKVNLAKEVGAEAAARAAAEKANFERVVAQGEANLKLQEDNKARAEKRSVRAGEKTVEDAAARKVAEEADYHRVVAQGEANLKLREKNKIWMDNRKNTKAAEAVLVDDGQKSEEMVRRKEAYEPGILLHKDQVEDRVIGNIQAELAKKIGELAKAESEKPARRTIFDARKKNLEKLRKEVEDLKAKIANTQQTREKTKADWKASESLRDAPPQPTVLNTERQRAKAGKEDEQDELMRQLAPEMGDDEESQAVA